MWKEVAQNRRHLSTKIQSSLVVVDFRFGSILCSHYSVKCLENLIRDVTIHFQDQSSAASLRHKNRSEIGVLCVNESPIRYVYGAGTRAIWYSVDSLKKKAVLSLVSCPSHSGKLVYTNSETWSKLPHTKLDQTFLFPHLHVYKWKISPFWYHVQV